MKESKMMRAVGDAVTLLAQYQKCGDDSLMGPEEQIAHAAEKRLATKALSILEPIYFTHFGGQGPHRIENGKCVYCEGDD
jgi:hypothetical protein